jgi:hypothetical protein
MKMNDCVSCNRRKENNKKASAMLERISGMLTFTILSVASLALLVFVGAVAFTGRVTISHEGTLLLVIGAGLCSLYIMGSYVVWVQTQQKKRE